MEFITWTALIVALYALFVAKNAHKRIDNSLPSGLTEKKQAKLNALRALLEDKPNKTN